MNTLKTSGKRKYNVGVSSCLLGHAVRYDGHHKYHEVIAVELAQHFTLTPFCPEMAIGMGVPRPPIHLVDINNKLHAVDKANSALDYTQQLSLQGNKYLLENNGLQGYIFQDRSPSCGAGSTRMHDKNGTFIGNHGTGIFADAVINTLPDLPIIEACCLDDPKVVADFIQRVREYQQLTHANL